MLTIAFSVLVSILVLVRSQKDIRISSRQHLTASYYNAPLEAGPGKKWVRIWDMSDEFWRKDLHHIWEPYNSNWAGRQPAYFKTENVLVKNHRLKLQSRGDSVPEHLKSKGYKDFSTSFIRTKNRHKYGYFEISAKLMNSKISSAFWFAYNEPGRTHSWWTEIDVFEYSTSKKNGVNHAYKLHTNAHVHRAPNSIMEEQEGTFPLKTPKSYDVDVNLSKDFHVYALDWSEETITWYLDGRKIREIKNLFWHRPMALQLDSETFPGWFGLPKKGENTKPKSFKVDYVRSWKRVDV